MGTCIEYMYTRDTIKIDSARNPEVDVNKMDYDWRDLQYYLSSIVWRFLVKEIQPTLLRRYR